jgi:hypothetical protein
VKGDNARQIGLGERPGGSVKIGGIICQPEAFQHAAKSAGDAVYIDRHSVAAQFCGDSPMRRGTKAADIVTQSSVTP